MKVRLNDHLSIPIHIQLKEQLKCLIEQGVYEPGEQLPSVRELAGFLRINRNTTQKAYTELERDGYVFSRAGKGVFAASSLPGRIDTRQEELIQRTLQKLEELLIDPQEFAMALLARHQVRKASGQAVPVVLFVECTRNMAEELAAQIGEETGAVVKPCLLGELENETGAVRSGFYDLIVTTFLHVEEVEAKVKAMESSQAPQVVACLLESNLLTMQRLHKLPKGSKVAIVGTTWEGTENIRTSILRSGLTSFQLVAASAEEPANVAAIVNDADLVVCSSYAAPFIKQLFPQVPVVMDDQHVNKQSIKLIKQMVEGRGAKR